MVPNTSSITLQEAASTARHFLGRDRRHAGSTPGPHGSALSLSDPVAEVGSAGAHGACSLEPPPRVAWLGWARRQYRQAPVAPRDGSAAPRRPLPPSARLGVAGAIASAGHPAGPSTVP